MAAGEFSVGRWNWRARNGSALIQYKSAQEMRQVKADGRDDARSTFLGRQQGKITVTLTWKRDKDSAGNPGPKDSFAVDMLADISSRGPNAGKSWAWVEDRQRIHNVSNVTVDDLTTVDPLGSGSGTATIQLTSWSKPARRPPVTATPTTPDPWSPGAEPINDGASPPQAGFDNAATKPKVSP